MYYRWAVDPRPRADRRHHFLHRPPATGSLGSLPAQSLGGAGPCWPGYGHAEDWTARCSEDRAVGLSTVEVGGGGLWYRELLAGQHRSHIPENWTGRTASRFLSAPGHISCREWKSSGPRRSLTPRLVLCHLWLTSGPTEGTSWPLSLPQGARVTST